jgi:hypothetical protein
MHIENHPGQLLVSMSEAFTQTMDDPQREKNQHFIHNAPVVFVPSIIHRPSQGRNLVEDLHYEIMNFARCTRPSLQVQYHVEAAIFCVRKGVKSVWPEADVEVSASQMHCYISVVLLYIYNTYRKMTSQYVSL